MFDPTLSNPHNAFRRVAYYFRITHNDRFPIQKNTRIKKTQTHKKHAQETPCIHTESKIKP